MKLWWRTRPAADEYVDLTDSSRRQAIRDAEWHAFADSQARILRVSGKPRPQGKRILAQVELVRSDRCTP